MFILGYLNVNKNHVAQHLSLTSTNFNPDFYVLFDQKSNFTDVKSLMFVCTFNRILWDERKFGLAFPSFHLIGKCSSSNPSRN